MKLLLTSGGITNDSIASALEVLVGKPLKESKVAFVPTAALCEAGEKNWLVDDMYRIRERFAGIDVVDIAQLTKDEWLKSLRTADVIFVGGGNTFYLSYWMQKSGLMAELPRLLETKVYAGISAGSMIVGQTLRIASQALAAGQLHDDEYEELGPVGRSSAQTAKLVPFVVRPHLNSRFFPNITGEHIQQIADELSMPVYALDDQSAVQVTGTDIKVISEGEWKLYE